MFTLTLYECINVHKCILHISLLLGILMIKTLKSKTHNKSSFYSCLQDTLTNSTDQHRLPGKCGCRWMVEMPGESWGWPGSSLVFSWSNEGISWMVVLRRKKKKNWKKGFFTFIYYYFYLINSTLRKATNITGHYTKSCAIKQQQQQLLLCW